jgi:hypothetical protein
MPTILLRARNIPGQRPLFGRLQYVQIPCKLQASYTSCSKLVRAPYNIAGEEACPYRLRTLQYCMDRLQHCWVGSLQLLFGPLSILYPRIRAYKIAGTCKPAILLTVQTTCTVQVDSFHPHAYTCVWQRVSISMRVPTKCQRCVQEPASSTSFTRMKLGGTQAGAGTGKALKHAEDLSPVTGSQRIPEHVVVVPV